MSTLNVQLLAVSYADVKVSNNPSIRTFDLSFKLMGQQADRAEAKNYSLAPNETRVIFNGTRSTSIDNSTLFTITKPLAYENTYRFTNTGGTDPGLRTNRNIGLDITTQFIITVNGPVSTMSHSGGTAPNLSSVAVGDSLKVENGAGFSSSNQGKFVIIAKTSTSISFENLSAVAETAIILDTSKYLIYSNGSNNQVQVGDKVVISNGFSTSSFGTYTVTEVTSKYFEVLISANKGIALESNIATGAAGLVFYSSAKKFVLIAAQEKCSIRFNNDTSDNTLVEPVEANNPEKPGTCLKQGTTYALSINNLSLEPLNVIVASVE